jgi:hypothetical protein
MATKAIGLTTMILPASGEDIRPATGSTVAGDEPEHRWQREVIELILINVFDEIDRVQRLQHRRSIITQFFDLEEREHLGVFAPTAWPEDKDFQYKYRSVDQPETVLDEPQEPVESSEQDRRGSNSVEQFEAAIRKIVDDCVASLISAVIDKVEPTVSAVESPIHRGSDLAQEASRPNSRSLEISKPQGNAENDSADKPNSPLNDAATPEMGSGLTQPQDSNIERVSAGENGHTDASPAAAADTATAVERLDPSNHAADVGNEEIENIASNAGKDNLEGGKNADNASVPSNAGVTTM